MADGYDFYRNGQSDDIIFIWRGGGRLETNFGNLRYRADDYIVIPRGTTYRLVPDDVAQEDYLVLESSHPVRIPARYLQPEGQIRMGAPYSERDFHGPSELSPDDAEGDFAVLVKDRSRLTRVVLASHPFDVVGWDGYLYPFTFNANDFEPITGTVHLPPPIHQTFEIRGYVVCTFAPRWLDHHPEAIRVPWAHDNTEADEVLFYVRGQFGSRKGIEPGSFTLHPQGIPHGPHPGHDREEPRRAAHRGARRDVRHPVPAAAYAGGPGPRRPGLSPELARLRNPPQAGTKSLVRPLPLL